MNGLVLVTGASGFTGRYLIPVLAKAGYDVRGVGLKDGDIRDPIAMRSIVMDTAPNYVIHLAGTPNLPDSERETAFRLNVDGTENLLRACALLKDPPKKILLPSSAYVYGETGELPAEESRPAFPQGEYGRSKLEMERVAESWRFSLPIVVVRPFNYTGVGHNERFLVPKLIKVFRELGDDVSFVDPEVERDFSDVRWVARTYAELIKSGEPGATYNVCSGTSARLTDLISLLSRITGHHPRRMPELPAIGEPVHRLVGSPARLAETVGNAGANLLESTLAWMLAGK